MNLLLVVAEFLLAASVCIYMQAMSIKIGKVSRKPTVGFVVLLLVAVPFFPELPGVLEHDYLRAMLTQVAIVVGTVLGAALVPVTGLLIASNIADRRP